MKKLSKWLNMTRLTDALAACHDAGTAAIMQFTRQGAYWSRAQRRRLSFRPTVETLEGRVVPSTLVAWWKLDEGGQATQAQDSATTEQDGSPEDDGTLTNGAAWVANDPPGAGSPPISPNPYSVQFDGEDDHIAIPNQDRDTFTFSAWVKREVGGIGTPAIIGSGSAGGWTIGFMGTTGEDDGQVFLTNIGSHVQSTGEVPTDGNWHLVTVSFDEGATKFYIDGELDTEASFGVTFSSQGDYKLGAYIDGSGDGIFQGRLDDVRIYSDVLTDDEVWDLYGSRVSVAVSPSSSTEGGGSLTYTFTRTNTVLPLTVHFDVGGDATFTDDYTVSGAASFAATAGTVTFAAGAATAAITVTPLSDAPVEGAETLSLTLTGGTGYTVGTPNSATGTINDNSPPTDITLSNASVNENEPPETLVGILGAVDPDTGNTFTYTIVGSNTNFTITGDQLKTAVSFDAETQNPQVVRVRVTDNGNAYYEEDFTITINNVNEAPENTVPGGQSTDEDTALNISGISIADVDAGTNPVSVSLSVGHGTLTLASTTGLSFVSGSNGAASMTVTGSIADINSALGGLSYAPAANYVGSDSLEIVTDDQGYSGSGGAKSDSDSVAITVDPVNDAPTDITLSGTQQCRREIRD